MQVPPMIPEAEASSLRLSTLNDRLRWLRRAVDVEGVLPVRVEEAAAAQRAVQELNNLAGEPLADWIDAELGQGLRLTRRGRRVAVALTVLQQAQQRLIDEFSGHFVDDARLLDRVVLRSSARNQFAARVVAIRDLEQARNEIELQLAGGQRLRTWVTQGSTQTLDLQIGAEVIALCKATSVRLLPAGDPACQADDSDLLAGVVLTVAARGGHAEVSVAMPGGLTTIAVVDEPQRWSPGQTVRVAFHPTHIVLGLVA